MNFIISMRRHIYLVSHVVIKRKVLGECRYFRFF
jgi:hypothetical protein